MLPTHGLRLYTRLRLVVHLLLSAAAAFYRFTFRLLLVLPTLHAFVVTHFTVHGCGSVYVYVAVTRFTTVTQLPVSSRLLPRTRAVAGYIYTPRLHCPFVVGSRSSSSWLIFVHRTFFTALRVYCVTPATYRSAPPRLPRLRLLRSYRFGYLVTHLVGYFVRRGYAVALPPLPVHTYWITAHTLYARYLWIACSCYLYHCLHTAFRSLYTVAVWICSSTTLFTTLCLV